MHYKGPIEAALSTDLRGEPYNFSLWDIYTGTQIVMFKGNKSSPIPKCLQMIDNNYFITACDNVLHFWSIYNKKCQDQKLFLPSRPSTLCMSPCSNFLIAGISEMIYVWQLRSGNLLAHTQRHYQTVSVLKMNRDGTFLFSGGEDGVVLVWPFADLISNTHNTGAMNLDKSRRDVGVNEPTFSWQHHSGQVTDIHITNGGRCLTSSIDMTVNIYSYSNGKRLYCVALPSPIWSLVMDKNETRIFIGAQDGNIYEIITSSLSLSLVNSLNKGGESPKPMLSGHKGKVVCLRLSSDGSRLISGSIDSTCKIWDVLQRKLLQDIKHPAPVSNLTTLLVPEALALTSMSQSITKPLLSLKPLKRNLYKPPRESSLLSEDLFEEESTTIVYVRNQVSMLEDEMQNQNFSARPDFKDIRKQLKAEVDDANMTDGDKLIALKKNMKDLYLLSAEKIFKDAFNESLQAYESMIH